MKLTLPRKLLINNESKMLLNSTDFYFYTKIYIFDILFNIIKNIFLYIFIILQGDPKRLSKEQLDQIRRTGQFHVSIAIVQGQY